MFLSAQESVVPKCQSAVQVGLVVMPPRVMSTQEDFANMRRQINNLAKKHKRAVASSSCVAHAVRRPRRGAASSRGGLMVYVLDRRRRRFFAWPWDAGQMGSGNRSW